VLLCILAAGSMWHLLLAYNAERHGLSANMNGKRVSIRAYSVPTAAWNKNLHRTSHDHACHAGVSVCLGLQAELNKPVLPR
jgi:uncharacterized protein YcbX